MGVFVLDKTIFDELNRGNMDVAYRVGQLGSGGHQLWMTQGLFRIVSRVPANARLAEDLKIQRPKKDVPVPVNMRGMYADHLDEDAAVLAKAKNGTLMTMNKSLVQVHKGLGGKTELPSQNPSQGKFDYNRTRHILGLGGVRFTPTGSIVPKQKNQPDVPPTFVIREKGQNRIYVPDVAKIHNSRTGSPVQPVKEHSLNPTPRVNALKLSLGGINWIVQGINDGIQQGRVEEAMKKLRPTIEGTLRAEPSLGVLIRIHYSRRQKSGAEHESPLQHTAAFLHISYEYGHTREEAAKKFRSRDELRNAGGGTPEFEEQWIQPHQPISPAQLPTPYQAVALCTFVPGREELLKVQFSHAMGIDEKMNSVLKLKGLNNASARFLVLDTPKEVNYTWNGSKRTEKLELSQTRPAQVIDWEAIHIYLPTIDMDSWINPYDGKAAMVYPANEATESVFSEGGRIDDKNARLVYESFEYVRFVKPKNIRMLKYFGPGIV